MSVYFLGIDNGVSGAIAIYDGKEVIDVLKYPKNNEIELFNFLKKYSSLGELIISVEMPFNSTLSSVTKVNFTVLGRYLMCFDVLGLSYIPACPRLGGWRPQIGFKAKGRENLKNESIERALQIKGAEKFIKYTGSKIINHKRTKIDMYDDNIADAINLCSYSQFIYSKKVAV